MTPDLALPIYQDSFWFGKLSVAEGHLVMVYAGPGQRKPSPTYTIAVVAARMRMPRPKALA